VPTDRALDKPKTLIMLGHGENAIFEAYLAINEQFPELDIQTVIADIRDHDRIERIFQEKRPGCRFSRSSPQARPIDGK